MKRRDFITLIGGAAAAWPLAARAQQPAPPVIGFMSSRSADDSAYLIEAFRQSLREAGLVEGQNVAIEFRWAGGQYDRLPALAAELVRRPVSVLIAVGGDPAVFAAKAATSTIPVVFGMGSDPVKLGLVASLNRPGGNITGIAIWTDQLEPKRLGLLHELMPKAKMIGVLLNPNFAPAVRASQEIRKAAETIGQQITMQMLPRRRSWMPHLQGWLHNAPRPCWSVRTRFSTRSAIRLSRLRRNTACLPFISFANTLLPVD